MTVSRRVVCDVACSPSPGDRLEPVEARESREPGQPQRHHAHHHEREQAEEATRDPRKTAMPTIGKNSPTAPAGMMNRPSGPPSMSLSRRIGSSVPSAVVVSARATGTKACTKPAAASSAGDRDRDHGADQPAGHGQSSGPLPEDDRARARSRPAGTGTPSPTLATSSIESGSASPATSGPISTPADDQHHHLGDPEAGQERAHERRGGRDDGDDQQRLQAGLEVHRPPSQHDWTHADVSDHSAASPRARPRHHAATCTGPADRVELVTQS